MTAERVTVPPSEWPEFVAGQQVAANPDTGAYSQGDRFGTVLAAEGNLVLVRMTSGRERTFHRQRLSLRMTSG